MRIILMVLLQLFLCSYHSESQINWIGIVDSNWNNPLNWNPGAVPDSLDDVNIVLNSSNPQPHWPVLQQTSKASRLYCENAEIRFNGNKLRSWEFFAKNSVLYGGPDTSTIELRLTQFGITLNNCTLNGDFKLVSNSAQTSTGVTISSHTVINGNLTAILSKRAHFFVSDSLRVSKNLVIVVRQDPPIIYPVPNMYLNSIIVEGDFSYSNQEGAVFICTNNKIRGKIDIDIKDLNPTTHSVSITNTSNLSPNGKISIIGSRITSLINSDFNVDSFFVKTDTGRIIIDSCKFRGAVVLHTGLSNRFNSGPNRLSGSTFFNNLSWIDTTLEIQETRGGYLSSPIVKAPNKYYGDTYFKGKIDLGNSDTSSFFSNLTIEPMAGSVLRSARFMGDDTSNISIGASPLEYAEVNKTGAGLLSITSPIKISGVMRFQNGTIITPGTHIHFLPGAIAENFASDRYVIGEVQKEGNSAFIFPVGSATEFKPFSITAPAGLGDLLSVQYSDASVVPLSDTSQRVAGLADISNCEYWDVKSLSGTPSVNISAAWDAACLDNTLYFTNPRDAQLARWDGSVWKNEGNGGYANGSIASTGSVPAVGLFTFASPKRIIDNPEPPQMPTMVVYPNPVRQTLNIIVEPGYKQGIIIDAIGRTVSTHNVQAGVNTIDVKHLSVGVYFFKLITNRTQKVLSWIKI